MRFTFENTEQNTKNEGGRFLGGSLLGGSLLGKPELEQIKTPKLWGNYRGGRFLIVKEQGAYMDLAKYLGGDVINVSACNVSDVSLSPTTQEKICPGDNQCRQIGLRQGPKCSPIKPSEGLLRYPEPFRG